VAKTKSATKKNIINSPNKIRLHLSLSFKTANMVYKLSAQIQFSPVTLFQYASEKSNITRICITKKESI